MEMIWKACLQGIVQGITEFLPVSSSGHLVLGKELFGIEAEGLTFEIAVHAATVLSTVVAFRNEKHLALACNLLGEGIEVVVSRGVL